MRNSKMSKVMKAVAHKFIIIYLAVFLAMPVQAVERIRYIHTDALGSPSAATDENGDVVWREYYRPYGERIMDATDDNRIWFTGKLEQSNIGLNYYGARWYDPMVGRFTGNDPAGVDPGNFNTFNRYCYANNNPYRYVDPDGRTAVAEAILLSLVIFVGINIYAESKRATINTFPSHQGGLNYYGGKSETPSFSSDTSFPSYIGEMPTWMPNDSEEPASASLPDLTGKSRGEAEQELGGSGFEHKGQTEGGYDKWYHPDGSRVQIRPDGEIVRSGPKVTPEGGGRKYRPRYDQNGNITDNHNTGEKLHD